MACLDEIGDVVCGERGLQGMRGRRADEPPPQRCRHVIAGARRRPREVTEGLAAHHQCHGVHAAVGCGGVRAQAGGWQRGWHGEVEARQSERRLRLKITLAEVRARRHAALCCVSNTSCGELQPPARRVGRYVSVRIKGHSRDKLRLLAFTYLIHSHTQVKSVVRQLSRCAGSKTLGNAPSVLRWPAGPDSAPGGRRHHRRRPVRPRDCSRAFQVALPPR